MATAKLGDTVAVHYSGKLEDGSVFDSSRDRDPLQFTLGDKGVIAGFQESVVGLEPGESRTTEIPCGKGYGPHNGELVVEFDRAAIPQEINPQIGLQLQVQIQSGQTLPAKVVGVSDEKVTLDANHPLAGQDLTFEIELVEIVS